MSLLTDDLRAMVGREVSYTAPEELGRAAIRYFATAVGDANPLYTDADFAREHGYGDVIAPPTLICETNQYAGLPADGEGYPGHSWRLELPNTRQVRGGNTYQFHQHVRPTDVVTATWLIAGMDERTTGSGADMLIVSSTATYTNQHGELLVSNEETIIFISLGGVAQ